MTSKVLQGILLALFVTACAQTDDGGSIQGGSAGGAGDAVASDAQTGDAMASEATAGGNDMAAKPEGEETMAASEPAPPPDSFTVLFDLDSWILSREAEAMIDDAVAAAALLGRQSFGIDGYADGSGGKRQNDRMSRLRAEAVADALILRGIGSDRIQTTAHGEADPAVADAGGNPEQANRRATISLR